MAHRNYPPQQGYAAMHELYTPHLLFSANVYAPFPNPAKVPTICCATTQPAATTLPATATYPATSTRPKLCVCTTTATATTIHAAATTTANTSAALQHPTYPTYPTCLPDTESISTAVPSTPTPWTTSRRPRTPTTSLVPLGIQAAFADTGNENKINAHTDPQR